MIIPFYRSQLKQISVDKLQKSKSNNLLRYLLQIEFRYRYFEIGNLHNRSNVPCTKSVPRATNFYHHQEFPPLPPFTNLSRTSPNFPPLFPNAYRSPISSEAAHPSPYGYADLAQALSSGPQSNDSDNQTRDSISDFVPITANSTVPGYPNNKNIRTYAFTSPYNGASTYVNDRKYRTSASMPPYASMLL